MNVPTEEAMEYFEIGAYAVLFVLNVLFSWLGARWIERKGYAEIKWLMFGLGICMGFVMQLLVISFLPGKRRPVARRSLNRTLPTARMPQPRVNTASESA
jgi:hypothetical protein